MFAIKNLFKCISIYVALQILLSWPAHIIFTHHDAHDNDCQFCLIMCSPELNCDCGAHLIARPENFTFAEQISSELPVMIRAVLNFSSRAPPLSLS
jgi:hypothetical protein